MVNTLKKRNQNITSVANTTRLMMKFAWKEKEGKVYILLMLAMSLVNAAFSAIYVVIPGYIINELTGKCDIETIVIYISIVTISPVISYYINKFHQLYSFRLRSSAEHKLITNFYDHVMSMDYETLEKPDIQLLKRRAFGTLDNVFGIVGIVAELVSSLVMVLTMSTVVSTLNPIVVLLVIVVVIINSAVTKKVNNLCYIIDKSRDEHENYSDVVRFMMNDIDYAQENRLFGLKKMLLDKFSQSTKVMNDNGYCLEKTSYKSRSCRVVTNMIQQTILYVYLIFQVISNGLGVGGLSIYMSSVNKLSEALNSVFAKYLVLSRNSLDIQDYIEFMSIPSIQKTSGSIIPSITKDSIIEFRNVSFKYPGSNRFVIENLNLKIKCDEKLCIVGENGSGKTTFVKLLTRMYFPTEGQILLDNVNINLFDYEKYQALFSAVFQKYAMYSMTLEENIVLSAQKDVKKLDLVCHNSDLITFVNKLEKKYSTQIGKEFDSEGVIPSGGESQKIAIARMLYNERPLYILDEPTATLDPVSENNIYEQVHRAISGKAAIMITHRLSAVQLADKVAVFKNGKIVEYGTHKELYKNGGLYTEMFDKQAHFYRQI